MPPRTWIKFLWFFAEELPQRGPLELWLQHAKCSTPAIAAEVEVVSSGKIFMTHGWGEVASMMFFKVFNEEGRRLECCPGGGRQDGAGAGA